MLDLNLDIISSSDSSCGINNYTNRKNKHVLFEGVEVEEKSKRPTLMEESATSNSSIINNSEEAITTPGDENSSNGDHKSNPSPVFDTLKKDANFKERKLREGLIVHELLPERSGSLDLNLRLCLEETSTQQRLGLPQEVNDVNNREVELGIVEEKKQQVRKSRRGPRSRSSQYRGVTLYRRTGRWESHIWDCGKQVYLGGFDTAHAAASVYDRAAIKFRGVEADINFNLSDYEEDMKQMRCLSKEDFVQFLRRQCTDLARGSFKFRDSALHRNGGWETQMALLPGRAYENTAINFNGREVASNFEHQNFEAENNLVPCSGGRSCNLDLSLGISLPSNDRNTNQHSVMACTKQPRNHGVFVLDSHGLDLAPMIIPSQMQDLEEQDDVEEENEVSEREVHFDLAQQLVKESDLNKPDELPFEDDLQI